MRNIKVLRGDLGFDGAVVSDDMQMGAITEHFSEEGAAVMAVAAGSDLLIYSTFDRADPFLAQRMAAVLSDAVSDGRLDRRKLEASKDRIDALRPRL